MTDDQTPRNEAAPAPSPDDDAAPTDAATGERRNDPGSSAPVSDARTHQRRAAWGAIALAARTVIEQVVTAFGTLYLARLLDPRDYGIFAVVRFSLEFFARLGDAGLGGALVQRRTPPTPRELANVFTLQLTLSCVVVGIIWAVAGLPLLGAIWADLPSDTPWLLRALAFELIFTAMGVVPMLLMERELQFTKVAVIDAARVVTFYAVAVALARRGYGVRTWVGAVLADATVTLVLANLMRPWRPRLALEREVLRPLTKFGVPYQLKNLFSFLDSAATPLYAGSKLGTYRLGLINWGRDMAFFSTKLVYIMSRVSFPLFAKLQDDPAELARAVGRSIQVCALVTYFTVGLFLGIGPNLTHVLVGDKWLSGINILYVYSGTVSITFLSPLCAAALDATGRPRAITMMIGAWTTLQWVLIPFGVARFGLYGFIAVDAFHMIAGNLLAVFLLRRAVPGVRVWGAVRAPLCGAVVVFVVGRQVFAGWASGPASVIASVAALAVVYVAFLFVIDRRLVGIALALARTRKMPA